MVRKEIVGGGGEATCARPASWRGIRTATSRHSSRPRESASMRRWRRTRAPGACARRFEKRRPLAPRRRARPPAPAQAAGGRGGDRLLRRPGRKAVEGSWRESKPGCGRRRRRRRSSGLLRWRPGTYWVTRRGVQVDRIASAGSFGASSIRSAVSSSSGPRVRPASWRAALRHVPGGVHHDGTLHVEVLLLVSA